MPSSSKSVEVTNKDRLHLSPAFDSLDRDEDEDKDHITGSINNSCLWSMLIPEQFSDWTWDNDS